MFFISFHVTMVVVVDPRSDYECFESIHVLGPLASTLWVALVAPHLCHTTWKSFRAVIQLKALTSILSIMSGSSKLIFFVITSVHSLKDHTGLCNYFQECASSSWKFSCGYPVGSVNLPLYAWSLLVDMVACCLKQQVRKSCWNSTFCGLIFRWCRGGLTDNVETKTNWKRDSNRDYSSTTKWL